MKTKKVILSLFLVFLFWGHNYADGAQHVLKACSAWPVAHDNNLTFNKLMELVAEKTKGSVQIKLVGGPEFIKEGDLATSAASGVIDILHSAPSYMGGSIPGGAIGEIFYEDFDTAGRVSIRLYQLMTPEYGEKLKIRPLGLTLVYPFYLWTRKPVHSFEELKGMKIRTHGGIIPFTTKALGVTPAKLASEEVYMSLQRGVIDGAARNLSSYNSFREYEVARFGIKSPIGFGTGFVCISVRAWNKLDESQKEAVKAAGEEISMVSAKYWDDKDNEYISRFGEQKVEFFDLPPQMKAEWVKLTDQGNREGALKLDAKSAEELLRFFKK